MHCRICLDDADSDFISPCKCSGTLKYVHRMCFRRWVEERAQHDQQFRCEICRTVYLTDSEEQRTGILQYIQHRLNFKRANRNIIALLIFTIHIYLFYFLVLSGPLEITIHSGQVPDMDLFLWEKSDAYAVVCLDRDCRCETEVSNNNNNPRWEHQCEYWKDRSTFIFSKITFLVFDSDIDQNDDFIGEVNINIYRIVFSVLNGQPIKLKWDIPYKATLVITVQWTSNLMCIINSLHD